MKRGYLFILTALLSTGLVACSTEKKEEVAVTDEIGGVITVVTNRVDADDEFEVIEQKFKEKYPSVEDIIWESSSDYDTYITTRMNTKDYGDVLFVPFSMNGNPSEYPNYLEPLGTVTELEKEYLDVTEADYDGVAYGLPASINRLGIVYNEEVLKAAGYESMPTNVEEFIAMCEAIKANTDAIPFYTNYNRVAVWAGALTSFGGEQYRSAMLEAGTGFAEGQPIREVMDIFYALASNGLIEADPVTLDSAKAQQMLADGEIAMLMTGSQDVPYIQSLTDVNQISLDSFPVEYNGKTSVALGADAVIGVNKNSENKATALAFLDFFVSGESGYTTGLNGMVAKKADLTPEQQEEIETSNVILTVPTETVETEELYALIANQVGVGRLTDALQQVINIGLYPQSNMSYEDYVAKLEADWAQAVQDNQ